MRNILAILGWFCALTMFYQLLYALLLWDSLADRRVAALLIMLPLASIVWWRRTKYLTPYFTFWLLNHGGLRKPDLEPETLRDKFMKCPYTKVDPIPGHTHPESAADRTAAASFADHMGLLCGGGAYFVQMSRADIRNDRVGSREHFWVKDLNVPRSDLYDSLGDSNIPNEAISVLVDVDQYIDMPDFLCNNIRPTLIYTFQPEACGREAKEYAYCFRNDVVDYRVTGGGQYQHRVWNWSIDNLLLTTTRYGVKFHVSYLVDRRKTSPDRELVFLTPMGCWYGDKIFVDGQKIEGSRLRRVQMDTGNGFNHLVIHSKQGLNVSVSKVGGYMAATLPMRTYEAILSVGKTSKYDLNMHVIATFIKADDNREMAAVLLEYYQSEHLDAKPPVMCPVDQAVRSYQYDPCRYDPAAKKSLKAFMAPFYNGAFAPDKTKANEEEAIRGRLIAVKPDLLERTPFITKCMREFLERLIPNGSAQTLVPQEYDDVRSQQARPAQVSKLERAMADLANWVSKTFPKSEAYSKVNTPRIISQINTPDKRDYSKFMYPLCELVKQHPWYAFGKKPKVISQRVVEVLLHADSAVCTDFSRFDGHVSNLLREFELMVLFRAFRPEHRSQASELHKKQHHLLTIAPLGTKYWVEYARLSGSPETSLFNTLDNAFIAYLALRSTMRDGAYVEADQAWAGLGIYGGDDGLTADVDAPSYKRAAEMVGQQLEVVVQPRYSPGVKFLSRYYSPAVWDGDLNSCCDIKRQLSKLHTTVALPESVTPQMKLLEKVRCLLVTDANTPILGDFARRIAALYGKDIVPNAATASVRSWWAQYEKIEQYYNQRDDWMMTLMSDQLPDFDYKGFGCWVERLTSIDQAMRGPQFAPQPLPDSKLPVVVDGTVYPQGHVPTSPVPPPVETIEQKCPTGEGKQLISDEEWEEAYRTSMFVAEVRTTSSEKSQAELSCGARLLISVADVGSRFGDSPVSTVQPVVSVTNPNPGLPVKVPTNVSVVDPQLAEFRISEAKTPSESVLAAALEGKEVKKSVVSMPASPETFEQCRERKIQRGTWREKPPKLDPSTTPYKASVAPGKGGDDPAACRSRPVKNRVGSTPGSQSSRANRGVKEGHKPP